MKKKVIRSKQDLGAFFSELREATGLRQSDFAGVMLGMVANAQQRYSRWEMGVSAPPMDDLLQIVDALGYEVVLIPKQDLRHGLNGKAEADERDAKSGR